MKVYKKSIIWVVVVMMVLMSLPLAGCSPKAKTDQKSGSIDDGAVKSIAVDQKELSSLVWHNDSDMMSLQDYLTASPFYTAPLIVDSEQEETYLSKRQFLIQETINASRMMDVNTRNLIIDIDNAQGSLLDAYKTVGLYDTEYSSVHDMLKTTFAKDMQKITLLVTQLDSLKEEESDTFNRAWNDYVYVYKTLEFSMETIDQITFLIQQGFIFEEALKQRQDLSNYHHIADSLMLIMDNFLQLDDSLNKQLVTIAQILDNLNKLEHADSYFVVSKLERLLEEQETFNSKLQSLQERKGLTQDDIDLVKATTHLNIELLYIQLAQISEQYNLRVSATDDMPWIPFAVYAQTDFENRSTQAIENATELLTPSQITPNTNSTPARGFFKTIKEGITKLPGALIEKASTAVYKYAFNEAATEYGLDHAVVEEEFKRVEAEELRRIVEGQAGSEAIRDGIRMIDRIENLPGDFAAAMLGEDSNSAKIIKEGSKFTIGYLTGSGKSLMTLLDPQASTGETTLALIDVAFCGIGSSKTAQNTLKVANQNIVAYASRKLTPISEFGSKLIAPFSKAFTKAKDKLVALGSDVLDSAASKLTQSPKASHLVQTIKNKATTLTSSAKDKVDELYFRTNDLADDAIDFTKQQYDDMLRETTINNSVIDLAMELNLEDAIANYVKGLVYAQIPDLVDTYIPEIILGEEELIQMAQERDAEQSSVQGNTENTITTTAAVTTPVDPSLASVTTSTTSTSTSTATATATRTTTTGKPVMTTPPPETTTAQASGDDYWLGTFKGKFSELDTIYGVEDISSHGMQLTVKEDSLHLTTDSSNSILNSPLNVTFTNLRFYAHPGYAGYRASSSTTIPSGVIQITGEETPDAHQLDITVYFWQDGIEGEINLYHGTNRIGKMYYKAKR